MKTYETDYRINSDFVHYNLIDNENFSINFKDYPLGSMPREANSFLISRLIQADIFPSPSCSTANSIALRNSGSNLNWNGGLPLREVFLSLCIDTLFSPVYIVYVSIHNTHTFTNKQAPEVLPARTEALITHLLKRSKSMTDYNSTPYTAIGVSKICSRNEIHLLSNKDENISPISKLLKSAILGYYALAVAKSAVEPENSNNQTLADSSTPLNRAFFVRGTRTPKEHLETLRGSECLYELGMSVFGHTQILSMVACSGKGSPFAVFQSSQFLSPLHVTAQTLRSLAVAPQNLTLELSAMIYLFKAVSRLDLRKTQKPFTSFPHYTLKVKADSVEQAQAKISRLFAVLSVSVVNNAANITACDTEQNNRLPNVGSCGHNDLTTTYDANRKRDTSGLFLPQIHNHGITTPKIYSELAVRATPRNKALSTNKGGYSYVAVEPLSHLSQSDKSFYQLTKTYDTMKKPTQTLTGTTAITTPIVRSPRFEGVMYA